MSFHLSIKTLKPVSIQVALFANQVGLYLNTLLNQEISELTSIKFAEVAGSVMLPIDVIDTGKSLFSYQYYDGLTMQKEGGYMLYGFNEDWQFHGDTPFYEFSVIELHRSHKTMQFAVAVAISLAAAKYLESDLIKDTSGIFCVDDRDFIEVAKVMSLGVSEQLPLRNAILKLYKNCSL
jgi:hypothetical protein